MQRASILDRIVAGPTTVGGERPPVRAAIREVMPAPAMPDAPIERGVEPVVAASDVASGPRPTPPSASTELAAPRGARTEPPPPPPRAETARAAVTAPVALPESLPRRSIVTRTELPPVREPMKPHGVPPAPASPRTIQHETRTIVAAPPPSARVLEPVPSRARVAPVREPRPPATREVIRVEKSERIVEREVDSVVRVEHAPAPPRPVAPRTEEPAPPRRHDPQPPPAASKVEPVKVPEPRVVTVVRDTPAQEPALPRPERVPATPARAAAVRAVVPQRALPAPAAAPPAPQRPRIDIQIGTLEIRTTQPLRRSDVRRIPARTHSVALDGDR